MATDGECDLEIRTIVHKGEYKWCKFNAAIGRYDEDNTPIFHAMITDITQIKKAEESADKMRDMLVEMFKNLPDPIFAPTPTIFGSFKLSARISSNFWDFHVFIFLMNTRAGLTIL